jgi:hypothetical protein
MRAEEFGISFNINRRQIKMMKACHKLYNKVWPSACAVGEKRKLK